MNKSRERVCNSTISMGEGGKNLLFFIFNKCLKAVKQSEKQILDILLASNEEPNELIENLTRAHKAEMHDMVSSFTEKSKHL